MSLTVELVLDTAKVVASFFIERLQGICTENYYSQTLDAGHAFLRGIHKKAAELGVNVNLNRIDVPLTPSDLLVGAGLAEREDGRDQTNTKRRKVSHRRRVSYGRKMHYQDNQCPGRAGYS